MRAAPVAVVGASIVYSSRSVVQAIGAPGACERSRTGRTSLNSSPPFLDHLSRAYFLVGVAT
jgi:hypothetical protein